MNCLRALQINVTSLRILSLNSDYDAVSGRLYPINLGGGGSGSRQKKRTNYNEYICNLSLGTVHGRPNVFFIPDETVSLIPLIRKASFITCGHRVAHQILTIRLFFFFSFCKMFRRSHFYVSIRIGSVSLLHICSFILILSSYIIDFSRNHLDFKPTFVPLSLSTRILIQTIKNKNYTIENNTIIP